MKKLLIIIIIFVYAGVTFAEDMGVEYVKRANAEFQNKRFRKALEIYNKALKFDVNKALVYYNIANVYYLLNQPWESIVYYQKVIDLAPDFINSYLNLAKILHKIREYDKAIAILKKAIEVKPDNEECLLLIGSCYMSLEVFPEAIYNFEKARELYPYKLTSYYFLTEAYLNLNDYESAIAQMEQAADISQDTQILSYLGDLYQANGNYDKAINTFENIIDVKKKDEAAYYRLAESYLANDQKFMAIDTLQRAIENIPEYIDAYILLGNIYFDNSFYEDAEKVFFKAAGINSQKVRVYIKNLAITYYNEKDEDKLRSLYMKALKIDPSLAGIMRELIKI
ncbi:MAG: tetratricopeptide repeat protein [Spirochaetes bacterium]|nr:tetratricopeptide repeat protein [Spirochaetota bacterium]